MSTRMNRRLLAAGTAAAALAIFAAPMPAFAQQRAFEFNIPVQDLGTALRALARASGEQVIFRGSAVRGRRSSPVVGTHAVDEALRIMLQGTGLGASRSRRGILVVSAVVGQVDSPASGEAIAGGAAAERGSAEEQTIVVTGSNIRGAPPTSPVLTLSRRDIDRTGATSIDQLMQTVPQNTQSGVNQENFLASVVDQDGSELGSGIDLRGLGQRATLVLLNGRRLAPGGAGTYVDVSQIPIGALQRVEILTDGASAIYGSDAVGGVVNFILRDRYQGFESAIQAGTSTQGGGDRLLLSQTAGHDWGSGNAMLAYEFRLENEIFAGDRPFTIGLPAGTSLWPRERRHSLLGTLEQDLAPRLHLGVTATYSTGTTRRTYFNSQSPFPLGLDGDAQTLTLSGQLSYTLPNDWLVRLDGNYARSDSFQRQTRSDNGDIVSERDFKNVIYETGLRVDGGIVDLPAGPVRLAFGAQHRWEENRDIFGSSFLPTLVRPAERRVRSVFGELLIPLFSASNRLPGLERLQLSAAGRFDSYSGTGSNFDPKIGILWTPVRGLNLRASYSTSFRAPLLSEVKGIYTALIYPSLYFYRDPASAPPGEIVTVLQGDDPGMRPETSRSWTFGADWSPPFARGLNLTFNYYSIRYENRIALPFSVLGVIGDPTYAPFVDVGPSAADVALILGNALSVSDFSGPGFTDGGATAADVDIVVDTRVTNTALTRTSGFDLGAHYSFEAGEHSFTIDANVVHILRFEDRFLPGSPLVSSLARPYRPLDWRGRGGLSWNRGGWSGSLFVNHADSYIDDRRPAVARVGAHTTVDANLTYLFGGEGASWLRNTRIALFVENLFDNDPPFLALDPARMTGLGYDPVNASGRGRFISLQVRKTW